MAHRKDMNFSQLSLLSISNVDDARVLYCRELLRTLEVVGERFNPDRSGWLYFQNFKYLRGVHAVACCIPSDVPELVESVRSAQYGMLEARSDGSDESEALTDTAGDLLQMLEPSKAFWENASFGSGQVTVFNRFKTGKNLATAWKDSFFWEIDHIYRLSHSVKLFQDGGSTYHSKALLGLAAIDGSNYWRDWYQGFLDGKPLDWELQRRVALIPDAHWDQGPAHIAGLIDEIRARYEVQLRAETVAALLAAPELLPAGIGHNNPPEALGDLPISQDDLTGASEMISRVLREVSKPIPNKTAIESAANWIKQTLWKATVWFAKKADMAIDEFVKKFAGYCAAAAGTIFAVSRTPGLLDALSGLSNAIQDWLPFLH